MRTSGIEVYATLSSIRFRKDPSMYLTGTAAEPLGQIAVFGADEEIGAMYLTAIGAGIEAAIMSIVKMVAGWRIHLRI